MSDDNYKSQFNENLQTYTPDFLRFMNEDFLPIFKINNSIQSENNKFISAQNLNLKNIHQSEKTSTIKTINRVENTSTKTINREENASTIEYNFKFSYLNDKNKNELINKLAPIKIEQTLPINLKLKEKKLDSSSKFNFYKKGFFLKELKDTNKHCLNTTSISKLKSKINKSKSNHYFSSNSIFTQNFDFNLKSKNIKNNFINKEDPIRKIKKKYNLIARYKNLHK